MSEYVHAFVVIVVMGIATFSTRILPPVIFGQGKKVPDYIMYLGKVVPYTAMGLLIVYCLRNISVLKAPYALPELLAVMIVVSTYLWRRNTIFSVVTGTVVYMIMMQRFGLG